MGTYVRQRLRATRKGTDSTIGQIYVMKEVKHYHNIKIWVNYGQLEMHHGKTIELLTNFTREKSINKPLF